MPITSRFAAAAARAYGLFRTVAGGAAAAVDPFFNYVTALLHGDGTNGAQNNTFLDSSTNNFTITRNGNTTQGTFSPFSQTGWSNYFDGSGDGISFGSNVNTNPASSDITVEAWIFPLAYNSYGPIFSNDINGGFHFGKIASGFGVRQYGTGDVVFTANTPALNQWTHVAVSRSGSSWYLFYNGIQVATATGSNTFTQGTACVGGNASTATEAWNGYLSNVRFVKGTALYTSNFTPSTTPLTAVTNTQLLTCQDNRYKDNSSNAYAVTVFGTPSVQAFSPFNPTSAWSASSNGGSGYFDGSGDYLTVPDNAAFDFGSGDFTISAWVYPQGAGAIIDQGGGGASSNRSFEIYMSSASAISNAYISSDGNYNASYNLTGTTVPNAWNFIEFTRSSGTIRLFVNGTLQSSAAANFTIFNSTATVAIGNTSQNTVNPFTGYIADVRVLKGTGSASSTVPTAPLTAIANTSLLLNYTNAGIYDNAAVGDYETVGNAQVSTSVVKYGTGSMAFDGVGDYLVAPSRQTTSLTGDFTIEFWAYRNSGAFRGFTIGDDSGASGLSVYYSSGSAVWIVYNTNATRISGGSATASIWQHIAVVRCAGIVKLYVNGTQVGSTWSSTATFSGALYIAAEYNAGTAYADTNGYIDDFRLTNGVCRYPYNFTPPTAAFPNIGGTVTPTSDQYFNYTTLLLPGNGTNGAQNNTFLDSSSNAFTITRNGNTTQGNFSPFSQTGWSNYFNGSSYLSTPNVVALPGNFTIETWVYYPGATSNGLYVGAINSSGYGYWCFYYNNSVNALRVVGTASATYIQSPSFTFPVNQWVHVAVTRSGTTVNWWVNGTSIGTTTDSTNWTGSAASTFVGSIDGTNQNVTAYLSNMRVVVGTAVYTSNFTPSIAPLAAVSGTWLLTCQSNRFVDNSSNAYALTSTGTSVQAFSPFAPTAAYSASTVGGSGYFDGSGDYLITTSTQVVPTGSFTVEALVYPTSSSDSYAVAQGTTGNAGRFSLGITSSLWYVQIGTAQVNAGSVVLNQWTHIAATFNGTTLTLYVNGTSVGTAATTTNAQNTTLRIGSLGPADWGTFYWTGYIGQVRVSNTVRTISVPTAPYSSDGNTTFLASYTNGGITDATAKNDLETVGNAQISTTQSKFGGSSMYFDGTGDWLYGVTNDPRFGFGTGDFTIEFWAWKSANGSAGYDGVLTVLSGATTNWYVELSATRGFLFYNKTSLQTCQNTTTTGINDSTWHHWAICRYGSTWYLFKDGIALTKNTDSIGASSISGGTIIYVGNGKDGASDYNFNGYIDDLRITKGIARYTSNFTPPTSAFLLQ